MFERDLEELLFEMGRFKKVDDGLRYHTSNPDQPVQYCHYTNDYFRTERSLFGEKVEGLNYDYSDRLWQWDYDKSREAFDVANKSGHPKRSANYYSAYLSAYFGKSIECLHILGCYHLSNGNEILVFGYREVQNV